MIYQGTSANEAGSGTQISTGAFNSKHDNKTYVGLVYNTSSQHGYGTPSTIMTTLNNWYSSNLVSYEKDYIDTGTGFCSDRNTASGDNYADNYFYYAAFDRRNGGASLQCHAEDILSKDNGKLQNPIGLVTSDEAVLTRITYNTPNTGSYLCTGEDYWTMSPAYFDSPSVYDGVGARVYLVDSDGNLKDFTDIRSITSGIRPVINLKADTPILSGDGSSDTPFVITE